MELAIFNDCRSLINNFVQKGSPEFLLFCSQWKQMMFQHIYTVPSSNIEVMQITASALHIAKRIACGYESENADNQQMQLLRRIGGIYLIYAIFFKQPNKEFVKVQATLDTWRELRVFMDTLPRVNSFDNVRYVFWKLLQAKAFRFTVLDYCVGLEPLVEYDKIDEDKDTNINDALKKRCSYSSTNIEIEEIKTTQLIIPALTVLEDGYNEMKEMLVNNISEEPSKMLPPTTIFQEISKAFDRIQHVINDYRTEKEPIIVENKKKNLKRKGFNVTPSERNIQTHAIKKTPKYFRRMSVRTVFTAQLPKDLLRDLHEHTDSEDDC